MDELTEKAEQERSISELVKLHKNRELILFAGTGWTQARQLLWNLYEIFR